MREKILHYLALLIFMLLGAIGGHYEGLSRGYENVLGSMQALTDIKEGRK